MDMDIKWAIRQFAYDLVKMNFFIVAYGALGLGNSTQYQIELVSTFLSGNMFSRMRTGNIFPAVFIRKRVCLILASLDFFEVLFSVEPHTYQRLI
jgi:hypothetical protein